MNAKKGGGTAKDVQRADDSPSCGVPHGGRAGETNHSPCYYSEPLGTHSERFVLVLGVEREPVSSCSVARSPPSRRKIVQRSLPPISIVAFASAKDLTIRKKSGRSAKLPPKFLFLQYIHPDSIV